MLVVKNKNCSSPNTFEQFLNRDLHQFLGTDFQTTSPHVNILENEKAFIIEMAAPGMNKENFQIQLEKNVLTISAEKTLRQAQGDKEDKKNNYLKREFSYQSFKRSFTISDHVAVDGIHANYENGILKVELPKKEKNDTPSTKTISIK